MTYKVEDFKKAAAGIEQRKQKHTELFEIFDDDMDPQLPSRG